MEWRSSTSAAQLPLKVLPTKVKLPPWTFLYPFSQEVQLSKSVENTTPAIIFVEDF